MIDSRPLGRGELEIPRRRLSDRLRASGIRDERVLEAIARVPRHLLIPEALRGQAYKDASLPIGDGQTISAPSTVAAMTEALRLVGTETVLEVGTGSGYQAAILSRLVARVVSIERIPRLAARARTALDNLGVSNVVVHLGDGTAGRPSEAPFDAIVVTAGGPEVPKPLLLQLAPGGYLVGPFGPRDRQQLIRMRRDDRGEFSREELGPCRFVELLGTHGWAAA
ncbi:MAG: protein-L-isoaspartate(D-aspartate) O-methyltransferase [Deltaproteobacteria bacterium]|jgi:protein-L-isoaspartate(D-aspartate) O-methyltransferase|nr:protein-L-isoaspartate(D-aspartate) O-methyltransferase [Deltaproteobacteria bacterium]